MRIPPCCLALAVLGTPLHAQALEDKITDLFIFGEGEQVLFLGGSGGSDDPTIQVHGIGPFRVDFVDSVFVQTVSGATVHIRDARRPLTPPEVASHFRDRKSVG